LDDVSFAAKRHAAGWIERKLSPRFINVAGNVLCPKNISTQFLITDYVLLFEKIYQGFNISDL